MIAPVLQEVRFLCDLEPYGHPGGPTHPVPVYARTATAAARIAMQVFPRGERRLRSVRDGSGVVWSSPDEQYNQQDILLHSSND